MRKEKDERDRLKLSLNLRCCTIMRGLESGFLSDETKMRSVLWNREEGNSWLTRKQHGDSKVEHFGSQKEMKIQNSKFFHHYAKHEKNMNTIRR
jgi:hypothetical protein